MGASERAAAHSQYDEMARAGQTRIMLLWLAVLLRARADDAPSAESDVWRVPILAAAMATRGQWRVELRGPRAECSSWGRELGTEASDGIGQAGDSRPAFDPLGLKTSAGVGGSCAEAPHLRPGKEAGGQAGAAAQVCAVDDRGDETDEASCGEDAILVSNTDDSSTGNEAAGASTGRGWEDEPVPATNATRTSEAKTDTLRPMPLRSQDDMPKGVNILSGQAACDVPVSDRVRLREAYADDAEVYYTSNESLCVCVCLCVCSYACIRRSTISHACHPPFFPVPTHLPTGRSGRLRGCCNGRNGRCPIRLRPLRGDRWVGGLYGEIAAGGGAE